MFFKLDGAFFLVMDGRTLPARNNGGRQPVHGAKEDQDKARDLDPKMVAEGEKIDNKSGWQ